MPGTSFTRPPENFKPDPKKGVAWCPYCAKAQAFVWDGYTRYARCPGCGISTDDFYTRFWNWPLSDQIRDERDAKTAAAREKLNTKEKFDLAVQNSGRKWPREKQAARERPLVLPTWQPPEEKSTWVDVTCPVCGRFIRSAYPPARERCFACGTAVAVDRSGKVSREAPEKAVYCRNCGRQLVTDPRPGAAYWCERCAAWSALPGDDKGEKEAARAETPRVPVRREELSEETVARVRELAAAECASFLPGGKCLLSGACVYWRDAGSCLWFETAVLPGSGLAAEVDPDKAAPVEMIEPVDPPEIKKPRTLAWAWGDGEWALYTEDPTVRERALALGLREVAEYRLARVRAPHAWQLLGPEEAVRGFVGGKRRGQPEETPAAGETVAPTEPPEVAEAPAAPSAKERRCAREGCGRPFVPTSNRQLYCPECRKEAKRERKTGWKQQKAGHIDPKTR